MICTDPIVGLVISGLVRAPEIALALGRPLDETALALARLVSEKVLFVRGDGCYFLHFSERRRLNDLFDRTRRAPLQLHPRTDIWGWRWVRFCPDEQD